MKVVYEPRGRAREYAELACNTYSTCPHGCRYCYAKSVMHKSAEEFHRCAVAREEPIRRYFESDMIEMKNSCDKRRVHLNFISDPYPPEEKTIRLTRYCIEKACEHGIGINILTKGRYDVVRADFDIMQKADVHFGVTCSFSDDSYRKEWEPNASSVQDRVRLLKEAKGLGMFTWVSMEPVIAPEQAIDFLRRMNGFVDLWKVGKLNYMSEANTTDWKKFRDDFTQEADALGAKYMLKKSLSEIV